jgi:hypothetical protein
MSQEESSTLPDGRENSDHLCSSCDRCRTKKIKCDGKRPCEACKTSYMRKNKIASVKEADLVRIGCVYSPAKRRGPPPKRILDYREMEERWEQDQGKKQRGHTEEQSITGVGQESSEIPSSANLNNMDAASILNLLGSVLNPPAPTVGFAQHPPAATPLMQPPPPQMDPLSAALQTLLSSLGSAVGSQGMMSGQGFGTGATAGAGHDVMSNISSTATQQLAYLQQLQQQLQLQQFLQQQLTLPRTEERQTSSMSSSAEDEKTSLQSEVERLRKRVNELEAENLSLKQKEMSLMLQMKLREHEK